MDELFEEQVGLGCLFQEEQRFIQTRALRVLMDILTYALIACGLAGTVAMLYKPDPVAARQSGFFGMYLTLFVMGFVFRWTLLKACLVTKVYSDHLYFHFRPFHQWPRWMMFNMPTSVLGLDEIAEFSVIQYSPWRTGWGIHYAPFNYGWVFNTSGNQGLAITTDKGKKMLIGSQKAQELFEAVKRAKERVQVDGK